MNETLTNHDTEPTLATRMNGTLAISRNGEGERQRQRYGRAEKKLVAPAAGHLACGRDCRLLAGVPSSHQSLDLRLGTDPGGCGGLLAGGAPEKKTTMT